MFIRFSPSVFNCGQENLKASVYIATSLDGFIARENGDLDWLPAIENAPGGEDYGYKEFMDSVDVIVLGRNTYEKVLTFGGWPYGKKPVVVLSSRPVDIPTTIASSVTRTFGTPAEILTGLSEHGSKHAYVDGGKTIQRFLGAGLIQQLIITRIPVLIGNGIPLFGPLSRDIKFHHLETRQFPNGLIQSRYEVVA